MSWHYQMIRRKLDTEEAEFNGYEHEYGIYEYYLKIGKEKRNLHTVDPIIFGESPEDVADQLKFMLLDIAKHGIKEYE